MHIFDCKIFNFSRTGMSFTKYFSTTGSTIFPFIYRLLPPPPLGYFHDFLPDFYEIKVPKMKLSPLHLGLILKFDFYPFLIHSKLITSILYLLKSCCKKFLLGKGSLNFPCVNNVNNDEKSGHFCFMSDMCEMTMFTLPYSKSMYKSFST